jgi:hypothetical protein
MEQRASVEDDDQWKCHDDNQGCAESDFDRFYDSQEIPASYVVDFNPR